MSAQPEIPEMLNLSAIFDPIIEIFLLIFLTFLHNKISKKRILSINCCIFLIIIIIATTSIQNNALPFTPGIQLLFLLWNLITIYKRRNKEIKKKRRNYW